MIRLSRIRNEMPLFLNEDLIEKLDGHHETTITLTNGDVYVVTESPDEVFSRIVEVRALIAAVASRLAVTPDFDHTKYLSVLTLNGGE
jgi:flagellar protein FlbD